MSTINVTNLSGRGGATPNLPDGANITGVVTSTSAVIGSGVTINSGGLNVTGVISATSYVGSGSNLTGVGESLAPFYYNPDVNDSLVLTTTGIGITFNKKVEAGSGTATLKIVNAGAAGTTIQSWGISSATYNITEFSLDALVSPLIVNQTYQVDIPSGFLVDTNETSYVGTAYTFTARDSQGKLWAWGSNSYGELGQNNVVPQSSPIQIPGEWGKTANSMSTGNVTKWMYHRLAIKTDGTLWTWGQNTGGRLGLNDTVKRSSPTQIPGTTYSTVSATYRGGQVVKTDGTLWAWGYGAHGQLAQNDVVERSSPIQIPGTTWAYAGGGLLWNFGLKTDGTLWTWGKNEDGNLGQNSNVKYSSPAQIPGTTWTNELSGSAISMMAVKSDGTAWVWGLNTDGQLGLNTNVARYSSPTQLPGTNWKSVQSGGTPSSLGVKTDGTLWIWGSNAYGALGLNQGTSVKISSPTQIPGTTWSKVCAAWNSHAAIKTDGTLWAWGNNNPGALGQSTLTRYSSPVQIPGTEWAHIGAYTLGFTAIQDDQTPPT